MIPCTSFEKGFSVTIPKKEEWENQGKSLLPQEALICYTDGSRLSEHDTSGAGVHFTDSREDLSIPLGRHATVFQAETYAIMTCAQSCSTNKNQNQLIYICSDSQAALKALASQRVYSKLVLECLSALKILGNDNTVTLVWVPGHTGILGNEIADTLARKAANTLYEGIEPAVGIAPRQARTAIREWCYKQHYKYWQNCTTARQARDHVSGPNRKRGEYLLRLSRCSLRQVIGVLTGHAALRKHMHTIRVIDDPICENCVREDETAIHFLGNCDRFMAPRQRIFGFPKLESMDVRKLNISDLLAYIKATHRFE